MAEKVINAKANVFYLLILKNRLLLLFTTSFIMFFWFFKRNSVFYVFRPCCICMDRIYLVIFIFRRWSFVAFTAVANFTRVYTSFAVNASCKTG